MEIIPEGAVSFDAYKDKFKHAKLERDRDGILLVTLHENGGPLAWNIYAHAEVPLLWDCVARDLENKVIILTGTGETFIDSFYASEADVKHDVASIKAWHRIQHEAMRIIESHLDIEVPMIAAVNGRAVEHSEQALLCDIVLSAEQAIWADVDHFTVGSVPGDGIHVVFPALMGLNRARYFLMTGQELTAAEAREMGLVNEVLPQDELLPRAYELAREIARKPEITLRSTRKVLTHQLRLRMQESLGFGLAAESLAIVDGLEEIASSHSSED